MRDPKRVPQHRAQRRDARAASDEDEPTFLGFDREREGAKRPFDVDFVAGPELEMVAGVAPIIDADEQLDPAVAARVFRRGGDRVRTAFRLPVRADHYSLAGGIVKGVSAEIESHDSRPCGRGEDFTDSEGEEHGRRRKICYRSMPLRRARGMVLRLVRRRAIATTVGLALALPSVWVEISGGAAGWVDGLALVCGATGAALIWAGLTGIRPDWIDDQT